jgi:enoyl-CoA hydratase/carnithine racemase
MGLAGPPAISDTSDARPRHALDGSLNLKCSPEIEYYDAMDRVATSVDDMGIARVCLKRPEKLNALDDAMFEAIRSAAATLRADASVRAVILHGAGPSFCAGLDVASLVAQDAGEPLTIGDAGHPANRFQRAAFDWTLVPAPVIAAIHGHCLGGGLQIALGADIRVAAPDARLAVLETKWGLIPDMALAYTIPRYLPLDVAKELTFTGRSVSGEEAHRLGLVTHVAEDPLAVAEELATAIAARSPDAVQAAKRVLNETWGATDATAVLRREVEAQLQILRGPNQHEAVRAALAGEQPRFADPPLTSEA